MSDDDTWRLHITYAEGEPLVTVRRAGIGVPMDIGNAEDALALARRIRHELIPDTSAAPGRVRIRQAYPLGEHAEHGSVVLHVQCEQPLTAGQVYLVGQVVEKIEALVSNLRLALRVRGRGDG